MCRYERTVEDRLGIYKHIHHGGMTLSLPIPLAADQGKGRLTLWCFLLTSTSSVAMGLPDEVKW